jgi:hypothetical protein
MKTIEQVKIELESIESGYPNAESKIRLANGYYVTFRKYDNRGNFKYTSFTIGKNYRLKEFKTYSEFIKSINNYLKRQMP